MTGDHLFMSHGVSLLATDDHWPSTAAFRSVLPPVAVDRSAIVVVSAHWWADPIQVTVDDTLPVLDEGAPTQVLAGDGPWNGHPELADDLVRTFTDAGLPTTARAGRGPDHGALIPLRFLDPSGRLPVVQVSMHAGFDPGLHTELGRTLGSVVADRPEPDLSRSGADMASVTASSKAATLVHRSWQWSSLSMSTWRFGS